MAKTNVPRYAFINKEKYYNVNLFVFLYRISRILKKIKTFVPIFNHQIIKIPTESNPCNMVTMRRNKAKAGTEMK